MGTSEVPAPRCQLRGASSGARLCGAHTRRQGPGAAPGPWNSCTSPWGEEMGVEQRQAEAGAGRGVRGPVRLSAAPQRLTSRRAGCGQPRPPSAAAP